MRIFAFYVAVAVFVACMPTDGSAGIVVQTSPPDHAASSVELTVTGGSWTTLSKDASGNYVGDPPTPTGTNWSQDYIITCFWNDGIRSQLYLRSTRNKTDIAIRFFNKNPPKTMQELKRLKNLGQDLNSLLETYQSARAIYRKLDDPKKSVGSEALWIWFDAAYTLAKDFAYLDTDREVIELARSSDSSYLKNMAQQFELLEWGDAALVPRFVAEGQLELAQQVNTNFSNMFNDLSPEKQKLVTSLYRINQNWFAGNAQLISSRLASRPTQ